MEDDNNMSTKKKREPERSQALLFRIKSEYENQKEHVQRVKHKLKKEKDSWFLAKENNKEKLITQFLQLCVLPRCRFTTVDPWYCSLFIFLLHDLRPNNFPILMLFDKLFSTYSLNYTVASYTENEVTRYGTFLSYVLERLMVWHSDKHAAQKECIGHPGYDIVKDKFTYDTLRHVVYKFQHLIASTAIHLLEADDYMKNKNGLILLTKLYPQFPKTKGHCDFVQKRLVRLKDLKNENHSLSALATLYSGKLKATRGLVLEGQFHSVGNVKKEDKANSKAKKGSSSTNTSPLKAATTNVPTLSTSVSGGSRSGGGGERGGGEVSSAGIKCEVPALANNSSGDVGRGVQVKKEVVLGDVVKREEDGMSSSVNTSGSTTAKTSGGGSSGPGSGLSEEGDKRKPSSKMNGGTTGDEKTGKSKEKKVKEKKAKDKDKEKSKKEGKEKRKSSHSRDRTKRKKENMEDSMEYTDTTQVPKEVGNGELDKDLAKESKSNSHDHACSDHTHHHIEGGGDVRGQPVYDSDGGGASGAGGGESKRRREEKYDGASDRKKKSSSSNDAFYHAQKYSRDRHSYTRTE